MTVWRSVAIVEAERVVSGRDACRGAVEAILVNVKIEMSKFFLYIPRLMPLTGRGIRYCRKGTPAN